MDGQDFREAVDDEIRIRPVAGRITLELAEGNMRGKPTYVGWCEECDHHLVSRAAAVQCVECGQRRELMPMVVQKRRRISCTIIDRLKRG